MRRYKRRPPEERIRDFDEVILPLSHDEAISEANRCIKCPIAPCSKACPLGLSGRDISQYIIRGDLEEAANVLYNVNPLLGVTARTCPQLLLCEGNCVLCLKGQPISIGLLQRYIADWAFMHKNKVKLEKLSDELSLNVAIIGSGPAGLMAAFELARRGASVTMFDKLDMPGGTPRYAIPTYRLPRDVLDFEISLIMQLGVRYKRKFVDDEYFKWLVDEYDIIILALGCTMPKRLEIPGKDGIGIIDAYSFLKSVYYDKSITNLDGTTVVIGCGDVAIDAARTAIRLGSERVIIAYRRSISEAPAYAPSIIEAEEEGVEFLWQVVPKQFILDDRGMLKELEFYKTKLTVQDESGRRKPEIIKGSEFRLRSSNAIVAIGRIPKPPCIIRTSRDGRILINENYMTNIPKVYAAGDVVLGEGHIVTAMCHGRDVALTIIRRLFKK